MPKIEPFEQHAQAYDAWFDTHPWAFRSEVNALRHGVEAREGTAESLPFEDRRFDVAACRDALHHFESDEPVLREIVRVLRPFGRLVPADFSGEGFALVSRVHGAEGHVHPRAAYTVDWAIHFLAGLGLSLLDRSRGHLQERALLRRAGPGAADGGESR